MLGTKVRQQERKGRKKRPAFTPLVLILITAFGYGIIQKQSTLATYRETEQIPVLTAPILETQIPATSTPETRAPPEQVQLFPVDTGFIPIGDTVASAGVALRVINSEAKSNLQQLGNLTVNLAIAQSEFDERALTLHNAVMLATTQSEIADAAMWFVEKEQWAKDQGDENYAALVREAREIEVRKYAKVIPESSAGIVPGAAPFLIKAAYALMALRGEDFGVTFSGEYLLRTVQRVYEELDRKAQAQFDREYPKERLHVEEHAQKEGTAPEPEEVTEQRVEDQIVADQMARTREKVMQKMELRVTTPDGTQVLIDQMAADLKRANALPLTQPSELGLGWGTAAISWAARDLYDLVSMGLLSAIRVKCLRRIDPIGASISVCTSISGEAHCLKKTPTLNYRGVLPIVTHMIYLADSMDTRIPASQDLGITTWQGKDPQREEHWARFLMLWPVGAQFPWQVGDKIGAETLIQALQRTPKLE
jgi:hypothetical protein